ncbi:MAG: protein phosphatase 2C domain-containing protein [Acidobacteriota bacterium]|nr:protein phosphatase 2C domain-containing protein [Acidobacteriota bacterium]
MSETPSAVMLEAASITDRGLSEKRPVNEDSFLSDAERRIFAVADGVGGADAGEVASQKAIEVLDEAFRQHHNGEDVEDLMELTLQRANASIHQLTQGKSGFSMMATTIVALHLDGRRATIGHVGDSRLYRLTPDGQLRRETADHSMVEEEVRAGRMTPEQAATHPSRNVISRALGAEALVEVDLKTIEVEDGTTFLLCSDGITRHIPDAEINELLNSAPTLDAACAEMKRRCYERGAEDNLTAVAVRVGPRAATPLVSTTTTADDDEPTLITGRAAAVTPAQMAIAGTTAATILQRPFHDAGVTNMTQPSRIEVNTESDYAATSDNKVIMPPAAAPAKHSGGFARAMGLLLLVLGVAAAAFYGGTQFPRFRTQLGLAPAATPTPEPAAIAPAVPDAEAAAMRFARAKHEIDMTPTALVSKLSNDSGGQPLASNDPEFLYLYGRALLLTGKHQEALLAFETAAQKMKSNSSPVGRDPLAVETGIATAAAALKSNNPEAARRAMQALDAVMEPAAGATNPLNSPGISPQPAGAPPVLSPTP